MCCEMREMKSEDLYTISGGGLIGFCLGYCFGTVVGAVGSIPVVVYGCVTKSSAEETAEASLALIVTTAAVFSAIGAALPV